MPHHITAAELGIEISGTHDERHLFAWFLASFFFGKRIQQEVARRTFSIFQAQQLMSPRASYQKDRKELIEILDLGHYVRYDESTAGYLLSWCKEFLDEYSGKFAEIKRRSSSKTDFERRLQALKGVGPTTTEIFMREAEPILF